MKRMFCLEWIATQTQRETECVCVWNVFNVERKI